MQSCRLDSTANICRITLRPYYVPVDVQSMSQRRGSSKKQNRYDCYLMNKTIELSAQCLAKNNTYELIFINVNNVIMVEWQFFAGGGLNSVELHTEVDGHLTVPGTPPGYYQLTFFSKKKKIIILIIMPERGGPPEQVRQ